MGELEMSALAVIESETTTTMRQCQNAYRSNWHKLTKCPTPSEQLWDLGRSRGQATQLVNLYIPGIGQEYFRNSFRC